MPPPLVRVVAVEDKLSVFREDDGATTDTETAVEDPEAVTTELEYTDEEGPVLVPSKDVDELIEAV